MSDEHHEPTDGAAPGQEPASLDEAAPGSAPSVQASVPPPSAPEAAPRAAAAGGEAMAWVQQNVAVAAGAAIAVVLILGVGGYFLFAGGAKKTVPATSSSGVALTPEQQAAIAQGVCGVTIQRVKDYGVLPSGATLASTEASKANQPGMESCQATSGGTQYALMAQVSCDDLSKADCVALDSVKSSDGTMLYHRRPYASQPMPMPTPATEVSQPDDQSPQQ